VAMDSNGIRGDWSSHTRTAAGASMLSATTRSVAQGGEFRVNSTTRRPRCIPRWRWTGNGNSSSLVQ